MGEKKKTPADEGVITGGAVMSALHLHLKYILVRFVTNCLCSGIKLKKVLAAAKASESSTLLSQQEAINSVMHPQSPAVAVAMVRRWFPVSLSPSAYAV